MENNYELFKIVKKSPTFARSNAKREKAMDALDQLQGGEAVALPISVATARTYVKHWKQQQVLDGVDMKHAKHRFEQSKQQNGSPLTVIYRVS